MYIDLFPAYKKGKLIYTTSEDKEPATCSCIMLVGFFVVGLLIVFITGILWIYQIPIFCI